MPSPVFRFAVVQGQSISWFLRRNCSVTPARLDWLHASICALSLGLATIFWFQGAVLVLPFAWLEPAAIGVASFVHARQADQRRVLAQEIGRALREGAGQPRGDSGRD
ncbi:MAG: DUF2244 domain-containing protein [Ramlibacter sp.]